MIDLFSAGTQHPLGDAAEVRRVLAALPPDDAAKAVDEIAGWFDSLRPADELRAERLFEIVDQLDQAGQPIVRRLTRDCLAAARLGRADENRLRTLGHAYWTGAAALYERIFDAALGKDKVAEKLRPSLPLLACRALAALIAAMKWDYYRHRHPPAGFWQRLGRIYLAAGEAGVAGKAVTLYGGMAGNASAEQEFLRAAVLASSALDALQPVEVELAERLSTHLLPLFVIARGEVAGMLFWIDAANDEPPRRLAVLPQVAPSLRIIAPGRAPEAAAALIHAVERGEVPQELNLGGQYAPRTVLKVLRHLARYWDAQPPLRAHRRHAVRTPVSVLRGFAACLAAVGGTAGEAGEEWLADNVSLGGFGIAVRQSRGAGARVGDLLGLRPAGGERWLLGLVRRFAVDAGGQAAIGVQTLSKNARVAEFKRSASGAYLVGAGFSGLVLSDPPIGEELLAVLPATFFDLRENLDATVDGRRLLLLPAESMEAGLDFEYVRFRVRSAG